MAELEERERGQRSDAVGARCGFLRVNSLLAS